MYIKLKINKRSQTLNTNSYGKKLNTNKFSRIDDISSAYSRRFKNMKRGSLDQTKQKYWIFAELD